MVPLLMSFPVKAQELVSRLESLTLAGADFRHRQHLEVAFWYLHSQGYEHGSEAIIRAIAVFTQHLGQTEKFHQTITLCWIRLVAAGMAEVGGCDTAEALIEHHPSLLDKELPLRFYSRARLFSDEARKQWIEPDLQPLPAIVAVIPQSRS